MARVLDTVVELQRALREQAQAQARLDGVPEWMEELHGEHTERKARIEELEEQAREAESARRQAEAAVEDAQEKLRHFQQQIGQVSTQREYAALLKEIDTVKSRIGASEEEALSSLERFEEAEKQLALERESFRDLDERHRAEMEKWEAEKPGVQEQIRRLNERIEVLEERLPKPVLGRFMRMYERHQGEPLAPIAEVEGGRTGPQMRHCGFCNYRVRPQVVVEIRNDGSLVQCDSCQRFLYLPDDVA